METNNGISPQKENINNYDLLKLNEVISVMFIGEELSQDQVEYLNKEHPRIQKFLEQPVESEEDLKMKKMMARMILIAKEKGYLPSEMQALLPPTTQAETPDEKEIRQEQTANTIEKAIDTVKRVYQVGKKIITPETAVEQAIDKAAVVVSSVADKIIDKGIDAVVNTGTKWVSTICPPLAPLAIIAGRFVKQFKKPIREVVKTGIQKVATVAKNVVKTVVNIGEKVGTALQRAWNWLFRPQPIF